jgi:plastocyanin
VTRRLACLALLAAAIAFVLPASASVLAGPVLTGVVGPGYEISLQDAGGHAVTNLAPGDYTFDIKDQSSIHNFHLMGPGVDTATSADEVDEIEWNLHLAAGTYTFFCDTHPDTMYGSFTVGDAPATPPPAPPPPPSPPPPPPAPPPSPPPAPAPAPPPSPAPAPAPAPPPSPAPAAAPPPAAGGTLTGTVGPGFVISLVDASNNPVKHLDPGTYTIAVSDKATVHNFHLTGPGVDQATTIGGTGDVTWTVTLMDGVYTYVCDAHSDTMVGMFAVGTASLPPPPPPPPPPSPPPATSGGGSKPASLAATVGPGYSIALKRGSSKVRTLKAGTYRVKVADRSSIHDFHLSGPRVDKRTGVGFKGTVTWTVKLKKKATYRYRCDPHKNVMHGSFRTT